MEAILRNAFTVDITDAVAAASAAAVNEASRQADLLLGGRPKPGDRDAGSGGADERRWWEIAAGLLHFRIVLAAGVDPLGTVVGLRRWGVTWELIARAAGVSRQAAHERWGRRVRETLDRYGTGELGGPVPDDEADLR